MGDNWELWKVQHSVVQWEDSSVSRTVEQMGQQLAVPTDDLSVPKKAQKSELDSVDPWAASKDELTAESSDDYSASMREWPLAMQRDEKLVDQKAQLSEATPDARSVSQSVYQSAYLSVLTKATPSAMQTAASMESPSVVSREDWMAGTTVAQSGRTSVDRWESPLESYSVDQMDDQLVVQLELSSAQTWDQKLAALKVDSKAESTET